MVEYIVDGDTIDVMVNGSIERVRLIGIDTPEIAHGSEPADCGGEEATRFLARNLPIGTPVVISRDVVARDHYGRLLGYITRATDEVSVNLLLAAAGYARPLSITPNVKLASEIADAYSIARRERVGIWGSCP